MIKKQAIDERNYVKKAVNWALRNIGKRNLSLHKKAIICAKEIDEIDRKTPWSEVEPEWWVRMMEIRRQLQEEVGKDE